MKKGFLGLLLAIGYWLLAIGLISFAEENKDCNKEVAKTYFRLQDGAFIEISIINSTTCPKPMEEIKLAIKISLTEKEKERVAKLLSFVIRGPGRCKTIEECEAYCFSTTAHMEECLSFAEKYNILSLDELKDAKKAIETLAQKGGDIPRERKSAGFRPPTCLPGDECL